jgi:hypothetical protein
MAATNVIGIGTAAVSSADIDVEIGDKVIALKGALPQAEVVIELKDDTGSYWPVDNLNGVSRLSTVLLAPGTYRASRRDRGVNGQCGVFTG